MERIGLCRIIVCVGLLTVLSPVWPQPAAARSVDEDFQTWGMLIVTGSVAPGSQTWKPFRYWMEGQARFGNNSSELSQAVIRPALGYAVNDRTSVWLGGIGFQPAVRLPLGTISTNTVAGSKCCGATSCRLEPS